MHFRYIYRKTTVLLTLTLFLLTLSNLPTRAAPTLATITEADIGGEWGNSLAGITDIGTLSDTETVLSGIGSSESDHEYIRFTIPTGGQLTNIAATGAGGGTWQLYLDDAPIDFSGLHVNVSGATYPARNLLISPLPAGDYDIYVRNQNATPPANWTITLTATLPVPSPGGISTNLAFWVKADANVFSDLGTTPATNGSFVRQWNTQAGSMTTEVQNGTTTNINYVTNAANFNPAIQFGGASGQSLQGASNTPSGYPSTIIVVAQPESSVSGVSGAFSGGGLAGQAGPGLYVDNVGQYIVDGGGAGATNSSNTEPAFNQYHIATGQYTQGDTQNSFMYFDGGLAENHTGAGTLIYNTHSNFEVGGRSYGGFPTRIFDGNIAEVLYYSTVLTDTTRNKVESYLAIKYGITLTGTQGISYTLSDDTTVWNATTNAAYHNDVAGIAQDDGSALYQPQSMSINNDALVTISGTVGADLSALLWGNNDGTTTLDQTAGAYLHMARVWQTAETGTVGSVLLSIPDSTGALYLLVDNDTDFSDATQYTLTSGGGMLTANVDFTNGQFFTFATDAPSSSPGGVASDLSLWLKANDGVSNTGGTVTGWIDQTGTNTFTPSGDPQTDASTINFNNTIDFDGTGDYLTGDTAITFAEVFAAVQQTDSGGLVISGNDLTGGCASYFFSAVPGNTLYIGDDQETEDHYIYTTTDFLGFRLLNAELAGAPTNTNSRIAINGDDRSVFNLDSPGPNNGLNPFTYEPYIGSCSPLGAYLNGSLGEVIVFSSGLSTTERNKVNSYLAIKYGITLRSTQGISYTLSDDTTVWNATTNTAYHHDVAGIAQDDESELYQPQSMSINSDALVTISGTIGADLSALLWGNNDGTTTLDQTAGAYLHMGRVWKTAETGTIGSVLLSIPDSIGALYLLVDNDTDFSDATQYTLTSGGGLLTASVDFTDGQFFTFAADADLSAPGGVDNNLAFWVKADASVFSDLGTTPATNGSFVRQWNTQAGSMTTEVQNGATTNINYVTNAANFNPAIQFGGASAQSLQGVSNTPSGYPSTIIVVAQPETSVSGVSGAFSGGGAAGQAGPGIYVDNLGQYVVDGDGGSPPNSSNTSPAFNQYHIATGQYTQNSTQNSFIFFDGGLAENHTGAGATVHNTFSNFEVGGRSYGGFPTRIFDGNITEVIYYSTVLTDTTRNKVESYLAIKYGITLTGTQGISYTLSDGTTVWNATTNTAYHHDVAGIAQDDGSALYQPQSMSINSDALVTISGTVGTDLSALLWGNNDGTTTFDQIAGSYAHMARVWQTAETGTVGSVLVSIPDSTGALYLLVDNDIDFSDATQYTLTSSGGSLTANVDFTDGQFFTFATDPIIPANIIGNALEFNGVNTYVTIANSASLNPNNSLTIEAWAYIESFNDYAAITGNAYDTDSTESGYGLYTRAANSVDFFVKTSSTATNTGWSRCIATGLSTNQWYHFAGVYDGTTLQLYVDGVAVAGCSGVNSPGTIIYTPTNAMKIGAYIDNDESHYFDGKVDEVRIWDVARSQGQIQSDMFGELTGGQSGLVAYYQMEDGQGKGATPITSLTDQTVYGNDGSLVNMNGLTEWNGRLWISDTVAASGGITMTHGSFLQDNGDDITFWFTNTLNANITNDVPVGVDVRWQRIWTSVVEDTSSNGGTVDITFDFDDARMGGGLPPAGPLTNYVLLYRASTTGDFTILVDGASSLSAGERTVTFANVDTTTLNGQITLGTKDVVTSPTAVTIQTTSTQNSMLSFIVLILLLLASLSGFVWWRRTEQF